MYVTYNDRVYVSLCVCIEFLLFVCVCVFLIIFRFILSHYTHLGLFGTEPCHDDFITIFGVIVELNRGKLSPNLVSIPFNIGIAA